MGFGYWATDLWKVGYCKSIEIRILGRRTIGRDKMIVYEQDNVQEIKEIIKKNLKWGNIAQAANVLSSKIDQLHSAGGVQVCRDLLNEFSIEVRGKYPSLLFSEGYILFRERQLDEAISLLEIARLNAKMLHQQDLGVKCYLELGRAYQRKDKFQKAYQQLWEAHQLIPSIKDNSLQADLYLSLSRICPDIGALKSGIEFANKALDIFNENNNILGQFECLWLMSLIFRQLGNYQEATNQLETAKLYHSAGNLDQQAYTKLVNSELHINWYKGYLPEALKKGMQLKELADNISDDIQRIFARILLGNLYRGIGEYEKAQYYYVRI